MYFAIIILTLMSLVKLIYFVLQTYQVYGMRSAEDIYKILTSQKANYVIIEESICNELRFNKGCRTKDLLDISNEHVSFGESTFILL